MTSQVTFDKAKIIWEAAFQKNSLHVPFLTWAWHNNWNEVFGKSFEPFYLVIDNEIIAPFVKKNNQILFSGGEEIADYLDLIGLDAKKADAWKQIIGYLKIHSINTLSLRNIPQNSSTLQFFKTIPEAQIVQEDTTPQITLPTQWTTYVESLPYKYRHELERKIRKFDREHTEIQFNISKDPGKDIEILLSLMEKDDQKKIFLTHPIKLFFKKTAETFADSISLLYITIHGEPASATLSFIEDGIYYLYNSGFDKVRHKNAGFYLKTKSVQYAIEHKCTVYNFLQGNERYKFDLGGKDFFVYSINCNL
jgi:hypothetical protein